MKKAIVIGATSGIGKELAKLLAHHQYKVGITGRRIELLEELKQANPVSFFIKTFDITDTELAASKLEELATELGGLDLVVISSGTGERQFWVTPVDKAARQMFDAIHRKKKIVYISKRWWLVAMVFKIIPGPVYDRI